MQVTIKMKPIVVSLPMGAAEQLVKQGLAAYVNVNDTETQMLCIPEWRGVVAQERKIHGNHKGKTA